ncbi:uncharacterized protein LOC130659463 [Hydractinia symbiolongicarpus]|uniref:uncharacterized protein LOC130659463 n=1 Tax=Hydractinia symbiolongicarpus TaxID=13093 RepID=UPI00254C7019|nr:uncharacterized protein LOC130659463 [Hydractinia symbiolongicarpus]
MKVPMPYDDRFSQYKSPYSTSGYAQVCREYGASANALYKFKAVMSSLTNGRWWPKVYGDWAKFILPTSQGLTSEGLTKLSERYNNNILIAPSNVNVGVYVDLNNKPIVKHTTPPRHSTPPIPPKHTTPPRHTTPPIHTTPPKHTIKPPPKHTTPPIPPKHTTPPIPSKHATPPIPPRHTTKHTIQAIPYTPSKHAIPPIPPDYTTSPEQPPQNQHQDTKTVLFTISVGLIIVYI